MTAETDARAAWRKLLEEEYQSRLVWWSDIREQMALLHAAASAYDAPVIAELGTRTGQSTSALLAGAAAAGGHVWSVDPGLVTVPDWWYRTGVWSFLAADDMSMDAKRWVPAALDVLFIDTSHTYSHTLDELREYAPRVRPGGVILCHDPELRRDDMVMGKGWVDDAESGPEYPVAAALDAYCAETGLSWERQVERPEADYSEPFYGLGWIRIPEGR